MQQLRQIIPALMIGVLAGGIGTFQSLQSNQANILSSSYGNGGNPQFTTQSVAGTRELPPSDGGTEDSTIGVGGEFIAGTDPDGNPYESEITEAIAQPDGTLVNSRSDTDSTSALVGKGGDVVDGDNGVEAIRYDRYTCGPTPNDILEITVANGSYLEQIIANPIFELLLGDETRLKCKDQLWDKELHKLVPTKDTPYSRYGWGIRNGKNPVGSLEGYVLTMVPKLANEGTCSFQRREKKWWGETKRVSHLQCGPKINLTPVACNVTLTENQGTFTHEAAFTNARQTTPSTCILKKTGTGGFGNLTIQYYKANGQKNTGTFKDMELSKGFGIRYRVECTVNNANTCSSNSISPK